MANFNTFLVFLFLVFASALAQSSGSSSGATDRASLIRDIMAMEFPAPGDPCPCCDYKKMMQKYQQTGSFVTAEFSVVNGAKQCSSSQTSGNQGSGNNQGSGYNQGSPSSAIFASGSSQSSSQSGAGGF
jgi:hypothetical protein